MTTHTFNHIAIIGAGAVGSFYGAMLERAGHKVTLIGRAAHVQAITKGGLKLNLSGASHDEIIHLQASTELDAISSADLVLFCVKSTDTLATAKEISKHLASNAVVMSLQNGVENAALIESQLSQPVIPSVVYVATELGGPGYVKHHGRGELVIGKSQNLRLKNPEETLSQLVDFFASAQVIVKISEDIRIELWSKLLINCAFNAMSGLAQIQYEMMPRLESVLSTQSELIKEVISVAKADGVNLSESLLLDAVAQIPKTMGSQKSSTAQDMARSKSSEIDHLNGFIVRRGKELGIPTPINQTLFALVKLVESKYTVKN